MFAVIYKFKVKIGDEDKFQKNWEVMTHEFINTHGGLGSCLHDGSNNLFLHTQDGRVELDG